MSFDLELGKRQKLKKLLKIEDNLLDILEMKLGEHFLPTDASGNIDISSNKRGEINDQKETLLDIAQQSKKISKKISDLTPTMESRLSDRIALKLGFKLGSGLSITDIIKYLPEEAEDIANDFSKAYAGKWKLPLEILMNFWTITLGEPIPEISTDRITKETHYNMFIAIVMGMDGANNEQAMETINKARSRCNL